jgi:hypothetical protein
MLSILSKEFCFDEICVWDECKDWSELRGIDTDGMVRGLLIYKPLIFHIVFYASNRPTDNKRRISQGSKIPIALMQPSYGMHT